MSMAEGGSELLWEPDPETVRSATLTHYLDWLRDQLGLSFSEYGELWQWSVDERASFWRSIWEYYEVRSSAPYTAPLAQDTMPGARWFTGARLNYAEHVLARRTAERPAIISAAGAVDDPAALRWNYELARARAAAGAGS
jgi:acetoacetyl-CoA synthetase